MNSILNPNLPLGEGVFDPEEVDRAILLFNKKLLCCFYSECPISSLTLQGKDNKISLSILKVLKNNVHENTVLFNMSKSLFQFYTAIRYIENAKASWIYSIEHRKEGRESIGVR